MIYIYAYIITGLWFYCNSDIKYKLPATLWPILAAMYAYYWAWCHWNE